MRKIGITSGLITLFILPGIYHGLFAQNPGRYMDRLALDIQPKETIVYKKVNNQELKLHVLAPGENRGIDNKQEVNKGRRDQYETKPCIIGIHGGGWSGGNPSMVYPILQEFVNRGWVGISIEYRLLDAARNVTVSDCVKDAKSAIRYIKMNAGELGIDSARITLCGLSAGGHIAAGAVLFDTINEESDHKQISTVPQYLILYYPVVDTSSRGYGNHKVGENWEELSPLHHIRENMPPTLIFHGMKDDVVPVEGVINFQKAMMWLGNSCDLIINGKGNHGYFLYSKPLYDEVIKQTFGYLTRIGQE